MQHEDITELLAWLRDVNYADAASAIAARCDPCGPNIPSEVATGQDYIDLALTIDRWTRDAIRIAVITHGSSISFRAKWFSGPFGATFEDADQWVMDPNKKVANELRSSKDFEWPRQRTTAR